MTLQPSLNLCLILIIIVPHFLLAKSNPLAPALYVFGDSVLDNGNNNWLPTNARADYAPYSDDFPTPVVLGRFTNGRTVVDFFAEFFGLPYPPPYASLFKGPNQAGLSDTITNTNLFQQNSFGGFNYASAACGILPDTGLYRGQCYPFDDQINMFRETVKSQLSEIYKDPTQHSKHLSKSIIIVMIGVNDYGNNYVLPLANSRKLDPSQFTQRLIDTFSQQLKKLYELGARKFVVNDIGPVGCIPQLKPKGKLCDDDFNDIVMIFNKMLPSMINALRSTLKDSYFVLASTYSFLYDAIATPSKHGFNNTSSPCCTTMLDGKFACIPGLPPCSNPNEYFFWDGYHPTQAVHSLMAHQLFNGSSLSSPINLYQLAQI